MFQQTDQRHVSLPVCDAEEADLMHRLKHGTVPVSAEEVLSGSGLAALFNAIAERDRGADRDGIAERVETGALRASDIDEETVSASLALSGLPDPDLLIRTGGEQRISNFMLWNLAYSELYFCDSLWPDFSEDDLRAALRYYAERQRRFGKTAKQLGVT